MLMALRIGWMGLRKSLPTIPDSGCSTLRPTGRAGAGGAVNPDNARAGQYAGLMPVTCLAHLAEVNLPAEETHLDFESSQRLSGTRARGSAFPSMLSRSSEYRMHAAVCAAQASVVSDPFKHFYEALEFQWLCLAQQAEREAVCEKVIDARAAA